MAKPEDFSTKIKAKLKESDVARQGAITKKGDTSGGSGGAVYFMGFVGALVYWFQAANGVGAVGTGVLKALVWPAYVVFRLLVGFYGNV